MRHHRVLVVLALFVSVFQSSAPAQNQRLPHETMSLRYTGTYKWVVYLNNTDLNFRPKPVADFPDFDAAQAVSAKLNKPLPLSSSYFYSVMERPGEPPAIPEIPEFNPGRSNPPKPPAPPADPLAGSTTWVGSETASDTTNLTFILKENGEAVAYDDTRNTWTGRWRKTGPSGVIINLYTPNAVNYYGTISGNSISGSAKRSGGNGGWRWNVTKQ